MSMTIAISITSNNCKNWRSE